MIPHTGGLLPVSSPSACNYKPRARPRQGLARAIARSSDDLGSPGCTPTPNRGARAAPDRGGPLKVAQSWPIFGEMGADRPKVMVVDDHELFRGGLVGLLSERGIQVVAEASLARQAIELVIERDPDVILMDLNMPGMSGIEATQRLTAIAPLKRVVVLTVMAD